MKYLALILALTASPVLASCPDPSLEADEHSASGPTLISPQSWPVRAQGITDVPCDDWVETGVLTGGATGRLPVAPTAQFQLDGMGPHILMVTAEARCDPVLAARGGDGIWYVGETANGREEITLWGAGNGLLQVWVGSADEVGCDATLTLETFDR